MSKAATNVGLANLRTSRLSQVILVRLNILDTEIKESGLKTKVQIFAQSIIRMMLISKKMKVERMNMDFILDSVN